MKQNTKIVQPSGSNQLIIAEWKMNNLLNRGLFYDAVKHIKVCSMCAAKLSAEAIIYKNRL